MSKPRVFFDITAGGAKIGRIVFEVLLVLSSAILSLNIALLTITKPHSIAEFGKCTP